MTRKGTRMPRKPPPKRKLHTIYVYGTLRTGDTPTVLVPGFLYDLGWYPGIELKTPGCNAWVVCEKLEVDDTRLAQLDRYEGYRPDDLKGSLYLRVPYLDGEIYTYNHSFSGRTLVTPLPEADWLIHVASRKKREKREFLERYAKEKE